MSQPLPTHRRLPMNVPLFLICLSSSDMPALCFVAALKRCVAARARALALPLMTPSTTRPTPHSAVLITYYEPKFPMLRRVDSGRQLWRRAHGTAECKAGKAVAHAKAARRRAGDRVRRWPAARPDLFRTAAKAGASGAACQRRPASPLPLPAAAGAAWERRRRRRAQRRHAGIAPPLPPPPACPWRPPRRILRRLFFPPTPCTWHPHPPHLHPCSPWHLRYSWPPLPAHCVQGACPLSPRAVLFKIR